ncbi:hypothetical protein [Tautonia sociabilis]|uniref:Lipoprotein n=1 Tax=Tautonia sociabilis TaxID=2080755 RepID=A0A432MGS0_9BACT|nr:hypothetical protein [Tautonia sociabilis]RUL86097.1 hypothetical protein TsocGM_16905 [Tautonia sociabilis]
MRRSLARFFLLALSIAPLGCGFASYEHRLEATQGRMRDEMILDRTLYGPSGGAFRENNIYLRVPKGLAETEFAPVTLTPGFFEVEASYIPQGSQGELAGGPLSLHVLARRTSQEPSEAQEQPDQPHVPRNDFRSDVMAVLAAVYGPGVNNAAVEPVNKTIWPRITPSGDAPPPTIPYERLTLTDLNQQLIHIYFYSAQSGNATYDVALIWEFPSGEPPTTGTNPVDLTLGTLAVGQRAQARFSGRPDSAGEGEAGAGAIAF